MKNFLVLIFCIAIQVTLQAQDTGEVRTVDGRNYRVHKVQAGETVFGLSRIYEVAASDIMKANPSAAEGLDIGQEVLIPIKEEIKASLTHTVAAGETLFAISKKYEVDIDEIQRLNAMEGVALREGQVLIIRAAAEEEKEEETTVQTDQDGEGTYAVQSGETLFAIARKFNVTVDDLMKWNQLESAQISLGQKLKIAAPGNSETEKTEVATGEKEEEAVENEVREEEEPDRIEDTTPTTTDEFVETVEKGVAELIPDTENTRKYLALHRTVRPGTIIRVRNEMNGREVWARVIGKLPETGENKDILVKVSKAAFDRLGAVDKKFRVTITYIP